MQRGAAVTFETNRRLLAKGSKRAKMRSQLSLIEQPGSHRGCDNSRGVSFQPANVLETRQVKNLPHELITASSRSIALRESPCSLPSLIEVA